MTAVKWWDKFIHLSCHCQHLFAAVHILWRTKPDKWTCFLGQIEFCDVLGTNSNLKWLITSWQMPGLCDILADHISSVQKMFHFTLGMHTFNQYIILILNWSKQLLLSISDTSFCKAFTCTSDKSFYSSKLIHISAELFRVVNLV